MLNAQPSTLLGTLFGGAITVLAQSTPALDPMTQWLANLGGLSVLIWVILRQDATRKTDNERCEREITYLREQVKTLWDQINEEKE